MTIETSGETIIDTVALTILQGQMRGELLTPGAPAYDEARRLNNGRFNRRPAVIARCRGAEELALMRRLKRTLDPASVLNPGKVIAAPG